MTLPENITGKKRTRDWDREEVHHLPVDWVEYLVEEMKKGDH